VAVAAAVVVNRAEALEASAKAAAVFLAEHPARGSDPC